MAGKLMMVIPMLLILAAGRPATGQNAFTEIGAAAGIRFDFRGFPYGGGIALGDFNGDGWEDIYLSNGRGKPNALFLNNGDETFRDIAAEAGVADTSEGMGTVCGDIDNDGDLDIFLSNHWRQNKLYINDGKAFFTDATIATGLDAVGPSTSVAMADYDRDGWLDIYVLNHAQDHLDYANTLYRNNGDGTFSDVTEKSGAGGASTSLAVGFFDFNNDMFPDIYVVNEYERDEILLNNRDGTFTNLRDKVVIPYGGGMGVDFADYDNDGDIDVYVSNLHRDFLLRNDHGETLTDVTAQAGIENLTMGWGVSFLDYDNDGDRDLHVVNGAMIWPNQYPERNVFFRNNGNGFFNEVARELGLDTEGDSRASACADFNNDGSVDIAVLNIDRGVFQLFKNNSRTNNWIKILLAGVKSNRYGIGAKVQVKTGGLTQIREIRAGSSYAANHSLVASFGLNKANVVDEIVVHWPSGGTQTLQNVAVNQMLTVTEAVASSNPPAHATQFMLFPNFPNPFNPGTNLPFRLMAEGQPTLRVFDISGVEVWRRELEPRPAGDYQVTWAGIDNRGRKVSAGVYFYQLVVRTGSATNATPVQKMVLIH